MMSLTSSDCLPHTIPGANQSSVDPLRSGVISDIRAAGTPSPRPSGRAGEEAWAKEAERTGLSGRWYDAEKRGV